MRVLGVDPGLTRLGVGIITLSGNRKVNFEHVEVLQSSPEVDLAKRIATLGSSIARILDSMTIDEVAIERVFAQQNLPSVMGVAQITGVVMYLAAIRDIPVTLYTPNEVKSKVTGYGAADKAQVTNMVTKILGLQQPPKPADAADALALAITHAWSGSAIKNTGAKPASQSPALQTWLAAEKAAKRRPR